MAIQTKDFSITVDSKDKSNVFTFLLRITENSIDTSANTSNVTVQAILKQSSTGICFMNKQAGVFCSANNRQLFSDYRARQLGGTNEHVYYTWTGDLSHREDGTLTVVFAGRFWLTDPGNNQPDTILLTNANMTMTAIPKNGTVGASDADIGANSTIVIVSGNANTTHSVAFRFGGLSGYILPDGSISPGERSFSDNVISFAIPESFYQQIPDKKSDTCYLTVKIYLGNQQVGENSTKFTVKTNGQQCAPLLTASVWDINEKALAVTQDADTLVRFVSPALCQAVAQGQKAAEIVSVTVNGLPMGEQLEMPQVETGTFSFVATDSRGYQTTCVVEKRFLPYMCLTCKPVARRIGPTTGQVELTVDGNCWMGDFTQGQNSLSARCRVGDGEWQTMNILRQDHGYSGTCLFENLHYTQSYMLEVEVQDLLDTVKTWTSISRGVPVFSWGEDYFCFHVPVRFEAGATGLTE